MRYVVVDRDGHVSCFVELQCGHDLQRSRYVHAAELVSVLLIVHARVLRRVALRNVRGGIQRYVVPHADVCRRDVVLSARDVQRPDVCLHPRRTTRALERISM